MVTTAGVGGVDGGLHRGRGAAAGIQLDQGVRPAVQRPLPRRQVLPGAGRHAGRGVPAAAGDARRRTARASATSVRTRTPGRSGRRWTCCCGCSRPGPARPGCSSAPRRSAGRACSATSASARPRASAGSTAEEHREIVDDFCDFMAGKADPLIRRLEREMAAAAGELDFEKAARLRDDLSARCAGRWRSRRWCSGDGTDADVVGIAADDLLASVQVFHVRGGRVRGQRGWIVDVDADTADRWRRRPATGTGRWWRTSCCSSTAAGRPTTARPRCRGRSWSRRCRPTPSELAAVAVRTCADRRVSLRVPQRGDKRALAETVTRNAAEALAQHRLKRASDLTARSAALAELADDPRAWTPRRCGSSASTSRTCRAPTWWPRWWCSRTGCPSERTIAGSPSGSIPATTSRRSPRWCAAGSPTAATGGSPIWRRSPTADDRSADRRPCRRATDPRIDPETGRPRRFAYPPQLLVVDGGAPQVNAAAAVLADLGIADVTVCGLAKRLEEVWVPGEDDPVIFPRTSEALYLLQRLRDEAHRFAITYHRAKRSKSMTVSALDGDRRTGPDPPHGAGQALRIGGRAAPGRRRADRRRARVSAGDRPAVHAALHRRRAQPPGRRHRRPARRRRRSPAGARPATDVRRRSESIRPRPSASHVERCWQEFPDDRAGSQQRSGRRDDRSAATDAAGRHRGGDRLRPLRRRAVDRGEVPGGPRLVRRRQPAARADRHHGRPRRPGPRRTSPGSRSCSTSGPGRSPRTWPR